MNGGVPNTVARVGLWGTGRIKGCKQTLGMTGALLGSQPPRIEELGREDRCSSTTSISTSTSTASISTRSPPLYYGANPLGPGDDRRMNTQPLHKVDVVPDAAEKQQQEEPSSAARNNRDPD
ncbi:ndt80 like dna-binding family protein [Colletotrichum sojae]|uniref:Ndt80 like dna-binding family protein n=1 Tax=Colletotrichum sojae TaxID=2175907 RepID=A0A8H6MYI6_9PEZI|nr:ndt80 like dna-binding family protein [Colletotrichum sojae]